MVKRLIHTLIEEEYSVTVCAPLGLLATNYREEFYPDLQADTIHALFNIPIAADQQYVVNYKATVAGLCAPNRSWFILLACCKDSNAPLKSFK